MNTFLFIKLQLFSYPSVKTYVLVSQKSTNNKMFFWRPGWVIWCDLKIILCDPGPVKKKLYQTQKTLFVKKGLIEQYDNTKIRDNSKDRQTHVNQCNSHQDFS